MDMQKLKNQKGFTLVEIAIVLVIIGLLLGGVLKGQELITNSKIKSVGKDLDGVAAAYYSYQDRIGEVAGDLAADGTGTPDGIITANSRFWFDLRTEGFVTGAPGNGTTDTSPLHALDGVITAYGGVGTVGADVLTTLFTQNYICASNIDATAAEGMDTKMDDGVRTTGTIRSNADYTAGTVVDLCKEL